MNSTSFMYGSELQGSGHISTESTVVGITMFVLALTGLLFGSINLYFIKNVKIFHNAFGWFWSGRTVSEMVVNSGYALYQGPVTILQPRALPPELGMLAYFVLCFGAVTSCSIHAAIAVNRNQAVYSPLRYGRIFTKKNSYAFIVFAWLNAALIIPTFCVFPCNLVGYSPQQYTYIYIKCYAGQERDFTYVGTIANYFCIILCTCTVFIDITTLLRILYLTMVLKKHKNDDLFQRNVRFFKQSAFQNVIMITGLAAVVLQNYQSVPVEHMEAKHKILNLMDTLGLLVIHVANPLSLLLFNPEVRGRLIGTISDDVSPSSKANNSAPNRRIFQRRSASDTLHSGDDNRRIQNQAVHQI